MRGSHQGFSVVVFSLVVFSVVVTMIGSVGLPSAAWAHDDHDGSPEDLSVVAGEIPATSAFDPDEPTDGPARLGGRLAATADCGDERTGLLQDNVPWLAGNPTIDPNGLGANAIELDAQGVEYCLISSSDLGTVDFSQFERLIISAAQNQGFYDNLFPVAESGPRAVHPALDEWVRDGGTLIANLTDRASGPGSGGSWGGRVFVGGVTYTAAFQDDNAIVDPTHPVVSGELPCLSLSCGRILDFEVFQRIDIDDWNSASHGYFNLPLGAHVVLSDGTGPVLGEYSHGDGSVLVSMVTTEWRYLGGFASFVNNRKLLANILSYQYQPDCTDDADCDGIADEVEESIGTDPNASDTDGDGLLDPWEVDPSVEGAGFKSSYPDGAELGFTQEDVFGPYGGPCWLPDSDLRVTAEMSCFNRPPDPLRADMYLELDWQDCHIDGCPELAGWKLDPLHHAPNLPGLGYTVNTFRDAPYDNPDGSRGVNLNLLVDERIAHEVNCDTNSSAQAADHFGTAEQREHEAWSSLRQVRRQAVRYVWSGHSSFQEGGCPSPGFVGIVATGFGLQNMESYDFSPFGDVNVGGRDLLMTLGPLWSCPAAIGVRGANPGPCYDATEIIPNPFGQPAVIFRPGIFPTRIDTPNGEIEAPYPISRLLGLSERRGMVQLWERSLTHLLGHSLGLGTEAEVRNRVDIAGVGAPGSKNPRSGQLYNAQWSQMQFAPSGAGIGTIREANPDYAGLAAADADGDGTPEGEDNCPGIPNPDQENSDIDEFGDACDGDTDGDGFIEGPDEGLGAQGFDALARASDAELFDAHDLDPYPGDTDNDGIPNETDPDDDDDGIDDVADNCSLVANLDQRDTDGDGEGDACDRDDDDDGYVDVAEAFGGSDPHDSDSTWELLGWDGTCSDGLDNDLDGVVDGDDLGCVDSDGDTNPDLTDNCPHLATTTWWDMDEDGVGDACDATPGGDGSADVWVADGHDISAVDPATGEVTTIEDGPLAAAAVALDPDLGRVWTYGDATLRAFDATGAEIVAVDVPVQSTNEIKATIEIGLSGDVWLAVKERVFRFAVDGSLLRNVALNDDIESMALDAVSGRVWVTQKHSVVQLDSELEVVRTVEFDGKPSAAAVDGGSDVWVSLPREVKVLERTGDELMTVAFDNEPGAITFSGGRAWVAVRDMVAVVNPAVGEIERIIDVTPGNSGPKLVDLEPGDGGVWASDKSSFRLVAPDGSLGEPLTIPSVASGNRSIRDIAIVGGGSVEPVDDSLGLLVLSPSDGGVVNTATTTVEGYVSHPADVFVDGVQATVTSDLRFEVDIELPAEGVNPIMVAAIGADGSTATTVIDVTLDTSPPDAPIVDSIVRTTVNLVELRGRSEPGAFVEIRNASIMEAEFLTYATAEDDGSFVASIPAATGHTVSLIAIDAAGNASPVTEVTAP